jgi:hypothetical protein
MSIELIERYQSALAEYEAVRHKPELRTDELERFLEAKHALIRDIKKNGPIVYDGYFYCQALIHRYPQLITQSIRKLRRLT